MGRATEITVELSTGIIVVAVWITLSTGIIVVVAWPELKVAGMIAFATCSTKDRERTEMGVDIWVQLVRWV